MKKLLLLITMAAAIVSACSKYDDSKIWNELNSLDSRVEKLETLCNQMNTNILSLQAIVAALQQNETISNVYTLPNGEGYTITFSTGKTITIYNGTNGKDGLNGSDGKDGKDGDLIFTSVVENEDNVVFTLADGSKITLPKTSTAVSPDDFIEFEDIVVKACLVKNFDTNYDGEISYAEAAAVTDFGTPFRSSEIRFFREFKYFTGVTSFSQSTFIGNETLVYVSLPPSLTTIGQSAFNSCTSLISVYIPSSVKSIGVSCFSGCTSLRSVNIPSSVKSIGEKCFYGCSSLENVIFEEGSQVSSIQYRTFYNCGKLKKVLLPGNLKSIGCEAFRATALSSVNIPKSVNRIGGWAFYSNTLENIVFETPASITTLKDSTHYSSSGTSRFPVFQGKRLKKVRIPASVITISGYVFDSDSLQYVSFEEGSLLQRCENGFDAAYGTLTIDAQNCTMLNYIKGVTYLLNFITSKVTPPDGGVSTVNLYVPLESIASYQSADIWKGASNFYPLSSWSPEEYQ